MEKQRINRASRFIKGLLALSLLFSLSSFNIYSQEKEPPLLRAVEQGKLYTESEIHFEMSLPNISSSEITILEDLNQVKDKNNVLFLSLKKYDDPLKGAVIQISYLFKKKGEYTLLPLIADINGTTLKLEFDKVYINNNPLKMVPTLVLKFSNGNEINSEDTDIPSILFKYYVGDKLGFTVYLQYATSLNLFNYTIPENSIYTETKTYEITNKDTKITTVSDTLIPIASFQWTTLKAGPTPLPSFKVSANGYDGKQYDITLPNTKINFVSKPLNMKDKEITEDKSFNDFFIETEDSSSFDKKEISLSEIEQLASLYKKENNAIFTYSKAKKERMMYEESLGLVSYYETTPLIYIYLSILLIIVFGILLYLVIRKRHFFKTIIFSLLFIGSVTLLIVTVSKRSKEYGLSKGCTIYSIPESTAATSYEIKKGSVVLVTETTDIWYHIQQGEASGWSPKDNIIIIK